MTNKEAIATLQNCAWLGTDKKVGQVEEAIQIAIDAMEIAESISQQLDCKIFHKELNSSISEKGAAESAQNVSDDELISKKTVLDAIMSQPPEAHYPSWYAEQIKGLPPAQPEIIRCRDCKHNPKDEWFGCPMSHLNEKQRPETAWCWKGERRTDG